MIAYIQIAHLAEMSDFGSNPILGIKITCFYAGYFRWLRALDEVRTAIQAIRDSSPFAIAH